MFLAERRRRKMSVRRRREEKEDRTGRRDLQLLQHMTTSAIPCHIERRVT
jgi:hypothetical protein